MVKRNEKYTLVTIEARGMGFLIHGWYTNTQAQNLVTHNQKCIWIYFKTKQNDLIELLILRRAETVNIRAKDFK